MTNGWTTGNKNPPKPDWYEVTNAEEIHKYINTRKRYWDGEYWNRIGAMWIKGFEGKMCVIAVPTFWRETE